MQYLIDDILPAFQVHLLSGASGAGKSRLLMQLLCEMSEGKPFVGHTVHPVPFAYIGADRCLEEYEEKFSLMGLKPFPIHSLLSNTSYQPRDLADPQKRLWALENILMAVPAVSLLVVDPLSTFLPAKLGDYHVVADALVDLGRWCLKHQVTLIGNHHATKLKPDTTFVRPQDRILGSAALLGYSGTHMFLTAPEETRERVHILTIVPHNHPGETHRFQSLPNGCFELIKDAEGVAAHYNLLKLIPYEPETIPWASLSIKATETLKVSEATLKRYLGDLIRDGYLAKPTHGQYSRRHVPS